MERSTVLVEKDVSEGLVSVERAKSDYGVIFRGDVGGVDEEGTKALRAIQQTDRAATET